MRKTRLTSWAAAPLAVWTTVQASPAWAQAVGLASAASSASGPTTTLGLPPRVPYLLIAIGIIAVIALLLALKALSEVRALKNELNGMKNR